MLKSCLTYALLFATALTSYAERVEADSLYRADIGKPLRDLVYHLRLSPDRYEDIKLSLFWNYVDSADHVRADLTIPPLTAIDNTDSAPIECRVYRKTASGDVLINSYSDVVTYSRGRNAAFSLVLSADNNGARLAFGDRHTQAGIPIHIDLGSPSALYFKCDRDANLLAHTLLTRNAAPIASFAGEIETTEDPLTGVWRYLDRKSDPAKVTGGIDYDIAVIATDSGSYTLVYQGDDSGRWHKGDVKGRLVPTAFENHYDLEWLDMSGKLHKEDTSADLLLDGTVLRLNFPLLGTTIRLRRK